MTVMPYRIETSRFILRCWDPADAALAKQAVDRSLPCLQQWLGWSLEEPKDLDQHIATRRRFRALFDSDQDYVYGIFSTKQDRVLGGTGLHPRLGPEALEIGYWIASDAQGQGLATEVSRVLTDIAFLRPETDRVEIHIHPHNRSSIRVPEKLGYQLEAVLKRRMRDIPGYGPEEPQDMMLWTMFRSDWLPLATGTYRMFDSLGRNMENTSV